MKRIYLIIVFQVFIFEGLNAQTWDWTHPEPNGNLDQNSEHDAAHDIEIDASGNVYVLGDFKGSLYLNNALITVGNGSYLAKYNAAGDMLWYKLLIPTYNTNHTSPIKATDLAVNATGVFITGRYEPSISNGYDCTMNTPIPIANPTTYSIGDFNFSSAYNDFGYFLTKMDFNGSVVWNKTGTKGYCFNNGGNLIYASGGYIGFFPLLTSDVNNNIITAFTFTSSLPSISIGNGIIPLSGSTQTNPIHIVIAKLNSNGDLQWSNYAIENNPFVQTDCNSIIADNNGDIFLYGLANSNCAFGSQIFTSTNTAGYSTFISKISSSGSWQFVKELSKRSQNTLDASAGGNPDFMTIDNLNNLYLLVNVPVSTTGGTILGEPVSTDLTRSYLVKINNNGSLLYKKGFGSNESVVNSIYYTNNSLYIAGNIRNRVEFAYGDHKWYFSNLTVKPTSPPQSGPAEYFVSKANTDGDFQWVTSFSGAYSYHDCLAVKAFADNVYNAGFSRGEITSLGNLNGSNSTNRGNIFFGKVKDQYIRIGAITPTSLCPGSTFTIPLTSYGLTFSSSNTFTAQISNASGSFTNARNVGSTISTGSGSITVTLPTDLPLSSTGYLVRIVSSDLLATGLPYYVYADIPYTLTITTQTYYQDADNDGYGNAAVSVQTCAPPANYVLNNTDCNDNNVAISPATVWYLDADNDNYYTGAGIIQCTSPGIGYRYSGLTGSGDCNDNNAAINPGALEICNSIDDDCDDQTDEGVTTTYYRDADGDGFGNAAVSSSACTAPAGYVSNSTDCNDNNIAINPSTVWFLDADNDNYYTGAGVTQCTSPGSGYRYTGLTGSGDCNDGNSTINPGVTEVCSNSVDDNCNGTINEGCNQTPSISINDISVYESQGLAVLTITLSNTSSVPIKVNYQTNDGSAVSKGRVKDFTAVKSSITIPAGSLNGSITIIINNDGMTEPDEYFDIELSLGRNVNATISKGSGRVTIIDGAPPTSARSSILSLNNLQISPQIIEKSAKTLGITILPNPSPSYFTLKLESDDLKSVMNVRTYNLLGKLVELKNDVFAGQSIQIGNNYRAGIYILELTQGIYKKQFKLLKL